MKPAILLLAISLAIAGTHGVAAAPAADTTRVAAKGLAGYWQRFIHGNIDHTYEKRVDISFVIYPSYSRETNFGIGGMATGLYRTGDRSDSLRMPSNFIFSADVALTGAYTLAASGTHYFGNDRSLLDYKARFYDKPLDFWGISYEACSSNPVSTYTRRQLTLQGLYTYKITARFHAAAELDIRHTAALRITAPEYLGGGRNSYFFAGMGAALRYDSRDRKENTLRGVLLHGGIIIYPAPLGNCGRTLLRATLQADWFTGVWDGGILAIDAYARIGSHDMPWPLREELGEGSRRMRGYYAGRYIDNYYMALQAEIRQHILGRLGAVAWVGCGGVFPSFDRLKAGNILPNYGIGLRFEFKSGINLRIDYGFGKRTGGFVLSMGEAF